MRIVEKAMEKVTFDSLHNGEVFKDTDNAYIWVRCVNQESKDTVNAVELESGMIAYFLPNEEVIPLFSAKLVID